MVYGPSSPTDTTDVIGEITLRLANGAASTVAPGSRASTWNTGIQIAGWCLHSVAIPRLKIVTGPLALETVAVA